MNHANTLTSPASAPAQNFRTLEEMNALISDMEDTFLQFQDKEDFRTNRIPPSHIPTTHSPHGTQAFTEGFGAKNHQSRCAAAAESAAPYTKAAAPCYAEQPYDTKNALQRAFTRYLQKGQIDRELKSHLLSRTEQGGFLLPGATLEKMDLIMAARCPLRHLARVQTIASESLELLLDKGPLAAGWMVAEELEAGAAPELEKVHIPVHSLYAKPKASQKVLDDAGESVEDWLIAKITQKMASLENQAFLQGDGQKQPKGILTYPLVAVGEGKWGAFEKVELKTAQRTLTRDVLLQALGALKTEFLPNATWLMARGAFLAVQNIKDEMGRFLWQPSLALDQPSCLLGHPVVVCDDLPDLAEEGASTPVVLGDFSEAYQIVDRSDVSVLRDPYSVKPYVEFYATKRVGGDVVNFDALKVVEVTVEK
ncbi:hypothetical protein AGMMS50296_8280 [Alphaproteobacteria bacterium]|nr:hypothetical protein AGMMS50296_8280 [Alphaproteobacteria bacterium]